MKRKPLPPLVRTAAFVLCVLTASLAFWSSMVTLANWDDLWSGGDYYSSNSIRAPLMHYRYRVVQMMELEMRQQWHGDLSYTEQEQLKGLKELLQPENTNFRYQVHHQESSELLSSNSADTAIGAFAAHEREVTTISEGVYYTNYDRRSYNEEGDSYDMVVQLPEGGNLRLETEQHEGQFSPYGWISDGYDWEYDQTQDSRVHVLPIAVDYGVIRPLTVEDEFYINRESYEDIQQFLPVLGALALLTICLSFGLLSLLCRNAGRQTERPGEVALTWWDRMPIDLYVSLYFLLLCVLISAGDPITWGFNNGPTPITVVGIGLLTAVIVSATISLALTVAVRVKSRTLIRNSCVWKLCAGLGRALRAMFDDWPMNKRAARLFLLYLLGTVVTTPTVVLIPVYQGFVLWHICRWVRQWRAIREGTEHVVGGDPDYKIDTTKMYRDLREHAEQLNDLGAAIGSAVDERMKSERFKAELITNVSHDLKTPLTSIINYVDLLKKTELQDPKALEYVEVLDRKSQRLKKLTEDLVEASKASTGALTVNKDRLGFTQLLDQALGEYEEKFRKSGLSPVLTSPDHELYVEADGRHLWRIIDNLLGNCVKYALPGTRVYLDVKSWDGNVTLAVKNISRDPLNVPEEALMERFVRGDVSRTTEGSGLGLSIARSLTELQGGSFRIDIDGDLFKAVVVFPEYREPLSLDEGRAGA